MKIITLTGYGEYEVTHPRITIDKSIRPTLCLIKRYTKCSDDTIAEKLFDGNKRIASETITELCHLGFAEEVIL